MVPASCISFLEFSLVSIGLRMRRPRIRAANTMVECRRESLVSWNPAGPPALELVEFRFATLRTGAGRSPGLVASEFLQPREIRR